MSKKSALRAPQQIADKIPYVRCYEEEGMIETEDGVFTKAYVIEDVKPGNIKNYEESFLIKNFAALINTIPDDMKCQFVVHDRIVKMEDFLKNVIQIPKDNIPAHMTDAYNREIAKNSAIGHNNTRKNTYFILSVHTEVPEDAVNRFREIDNTIRTMFMKIYGINAVGLTCAGRLKSMYTMFNSGRNTFGQKADLRGDGEFSIKNMARMKLSTKDMIAPISIKEYDKSALVLNEDTYVRTFFVACLPDSIASNFVSDITSVSSNMIYSMQLESLNAQIGFDEISKNISENTIVKQHRKLDSVQDRRNKTVSREEILLEMNEDTYFDKQAIEMMKEAVASGNKVKMCTIAIALYADSIENLDRDTKLLKISCSKFACQIKCLYGRQLEGLQSVLPLCVCKFDAKRVFPSGRLAYMQPLSIHDILKRDGLYNGLNAINDNLVLFNRKNNTNYAGIIAGTEHSGKTIQCKREIFNALMSTDDVMFILSNNDEYDEYIKQYGGQVIDDLKINAFCMPEHYGIINNDRYSKSVMLEAVLDCLTARTKKDENLEYFEKEEEIEARNEEIEQEVHSLILADESGDVNFNDINTVADYIYTNETDYPYFAACVDKIKAYALNGNDITDMFANRVNVIHYTDKLDLILKLDALFVSGIELSKKNRGNWLFADPIDVMLMTDQSNSYLIETIQKLNMIRIPTTFVIGSTVKLLANADMPMRLTDLVNTCGYFKLLNQGVIERKFYVETLNIPSSLESYITTADPGNGIIMTSSSNVAFDDNYNNQDSEFYSIFTV